MEERQAAGEVGEDGQPVTTPDPPPWYKPHLSPDEYVGQAKGKKQVAWERGMWKDGMIEKVDEDDAKGRDQSMSLNHVLSSCPDFRAEKPCRHVLRLICGAFGGLRIARPPSNLAME